MNLGPGQIPSRPATAATDEEAGLWRAFKADRSVRARERLFNFHYPFARKIARKHYYGRTGGDIEFSDLCQLASAGLLEALDGYDPDLGVPFTGYARRRISGSILDGIAKASEVREQISFRNRMRTERTRSLAESNPDDLSADEAMRALIDLTVGLALSFMLEDTGLYVSEQAPVRQVNAYDSLAWKEMVQRLATEVSDLPEREQAIIRQHYMHNLTFDQIGAMLGVTKGRVSQIHKGAMALLRKRLANAGHFKVER